MTPADAANQVCKSLTRLVGEIAPKGIGHWDRAWDIVADADVEFVQALLAWEREPTVEAQARVQVAFNAVLEQWQFAGHPPYEPRLHRSVASVRRR